MHTAESNHAEEVLYVELPANHKPTEMNDGAKRKAVLLANACGSFRALNACLLLELSGLKWRPTSENPFGDLEPQRLIP